MLGDLLGRGGMAEVFAGYAVGDHGFQKPVAIKRLLPELANDEVFVERLIEEAKLLVGMQHGNVVSVIDLAREGDDVFLVMEFVDGPSLRQLIKARGTRGLSVGVATYIVQSAAAGLEFAHARPGGAIGLGTHTFGCNCDGHALSICNRCTGPKRSDLQGFRPRPAGKR